MNIKKSPLLAGLLSLSAVFGSMTGKAEGYTITQDDMEKIFAQGEVADIPVGNGQAIISVTSNGWSKTEENYNYETHQLETRTWRAPFIVHNADKSSGFARAYTNMPEIATIAVNEDNGNVYGFKSNESSEFYQIGTGNITATDPLPVLAQLKPTATTLGFYTLNGDAYQTATATVKSAFAWSVGEYDYILAYNPEGGVSRTTVWRRNGIVNRQAYFVGVEPKNVLRGDNVIYYGNDTSMVSISKSNPTNAVPVTLMSDRVGMSVVGDTLYQATHDGFYNQDGKLGISKLVVDGGDIVLGPLVNSIDIEHMTVTYDKTKLVIACDATEDFAIGNYLLSDNTSVIGVKGATQVVAKQDGIYAMIKNQMVRVHD